MTFVILTAGIDLSVGSLLALAGLVGAYVAKGGLADRFAIGAADVHGNPVIAAAAAAIAVGILGGAAAGPRHHPAPGAALRGDARRADRLPRRGAALLRRRPDLGLRARTSPGGARAASPRCRCR